MNEWFRNQDIGPKEEIIKLATELVRQGLEITQLALRDDFIDYEFRANKLFQILQAFRRKG